MRRLQTVRVAVCTRGQHIITALYTCTHGCVDAIVKCVRLASVDISLIPIRLCFVNILLDLNDSFSVDTTGM